MKTAIIAMLCVVFVAAPAEAYVGPGVGLGALSVVGGIIFSMFLAILGAIWYPIKRLLFGRKRKSKEAVSTVRPADDN